MKVDGDTQLTSYNSFRHFGLSGSLFPYRTACYWSTVQITDKDYFTGRFKKVTNMDCCLQQGKLCAATTSPCG